MTKPLAIAGGDAGTPQWFAIAVLLAAAIDIGGCATSYPDPPREVRSQVCDPVMQWRGPVEWEVRWHIFERCVGGELTPAEALGEFNAEAADTALRRVRATRARAQKAEEAREWALVADLRSPPVPTLDGMTPNDGVVTELKAARREMAARDLLDERRLSVTPMP